MIKTKVNKEIRELIKMQFNLVLDVDEIPNDVLFGTASGFDSTSLLEFIITLEEHFDIIIPDEDLSPSNFETIDKMVDFISALKNV